MMENAAMVAPPCQLRMQIRGLPQEQATDPEELVDNNDDSQVATRWLHSSACAAGRPYGRLPSHQLMSSVSEHWVWRPCMLACAGSCIGHGSRTS